MLLYHGSDTVIECPRISLNTGFSDLGRGFYLTDDAEAAAGRARSRARKTGGVGHVSAFSFDWDDLPWIAQGMEPGPPAPRDAQPAAPFGLLFEPGMPGITAWIRYIKSCRAGNTALPGLGEPAVVRAWIATEEVEMACTGMLEPEEVAEFVDARALVTQYCFRNQEVLDALLHFESALPV